jgi:hypothetical protein
MTAGLGVTTYDTDAAKAILAGLLDTPDAMPIEDPLSIGTVLALAEQVRAARAERDDARGRLQAVRETCWPLHRNPGRLGDFARTVLIEADPQPETAEVTL